MRHADILDEGERLQGPLLGSVLLHVGAAAAFLAYGWLAGRNRETWGSQDLLGGGSVGVNPVKGIPLPHRSGALNPLANDTESRVPAPPKDKPKARVEIPDKNAVVLKSKDAEKKPSRRETAEQRFRPEKIDRDNQVFSRESQALASPMISASGSGGVGVGSNSSLGNQFGWYMDLVKQRIAQRWNTTEVDAHLQTAPAVIVTFDIRRDGSVSNVSVFQRSGIPALDYSTQRAIGEAAPFPALPGGRDRAQMEIWFQLKR